MRLWVLEQEGSLALRWMGTGVALGGKTRGLWMFGIYSRVAHGIFWRSIWVRLIGLLFAAISMAVATTSTGRVGW